MEITLLHSAQVETSRAIATALGLDAVNVVDQTITQDSHTIRVLGKHSLAVGVCPNFSEYPALVVTDAGVTRVKSGVASWGDCLDFINNPPAEPVAQPVTTMSKYTFARRFTGAERQAILTASISDVVIQDARNLLEMAQDVDLGDTNVQNYIAYLVSAGHVTQARATEILTP